MADRRLGLLMTSLFVLTSPLNARPDDVGAALTAAADAAARQDGIAAEAAIRRALSAGASQVDVAARMGEALLLQGDLARARDWLEPGQFSQRDAALGWRMTGLLLRAEGRLPEAGRAYDRALAVAPNDPLLWVDIARLLYSGAEHFLAVEAAERAFELAPSNPRAIELRAQLLIDGAGPVAAIPMFERGLKIAPNDRELLVGYAGALGQAGRAVDMLKVARRLHALNPRSPVPFYLQAVIAARAGQIDLARRLLDRMGKNLKEVPAAVLLTSALELEAGNSGIAVNMLERLDRRQPFNQRVQLLYAKALLMVDDHPRLRQRFGPVAQRRDASPYLLCILGRSYERTGDRETAAIYLQRAVTAAFSFPPERFREDPLWAAGSFQAAVVAGDNALLNGANGHAFDAYRAAARLRYPEWLMLRAAYAGGGAEVVPMAEEYLAAFPDSLLAPRLIADAAAQDGKWDRVTTLLSGTSQRQGWSDPGALADLAVARLQSGQAEAALAPAETAYRLQRSNANAAQALGMVLAKLGRDPVRAANLLNKAEALRGSNPAIVAARAQLQSH